MNWQTSRTIALGMSLIGAAWLAQAADAPKSDDKAMHAMAKPMTDAQQIASAITAAPRAIGRGAAVVAANADGSMRTLRKGTNAYTCMADSPETPGPDPMCWDAGAGAWINAWLKHTTPPAG